MTAPADIDDLAMLAEFALLAMARVKAASARAEIVEAEGGDPTIHLRAMDRMGRAMRLALNLRRRFADEAEVQIARRAQVRKERLKAALTPAIYIHADISERRERQWELDERLETEADGFAGISLEDGLARLRQILGLPALTAIASGPCAPSVSALRADPPPPLREGGAKRSRSSPEGNTSGEVARLAKRGVTEGAQAPDATARLTPDLIALARGATGPP